ncbi:16S rRNA (cytidine(1402)-2'-O)-methyltransferase [Candidatus Aerophobetes bacterium]|nr:16S rRNA (cytidine(1402)-2'-O)-methyltransferase [Candidatus Aerophobetes bacterium]
MSSNEPLIKDCGTLYIVGTPIGNLKDVSFRVLRTLKEVDLIAAEDTRHTRKLLSHYDIHTPLTSFYEYNQEKKAPYLIKKIREGANIALVSKAGMPGISDPGYHLIKKAVEADIQIIPVPGPCALVVALVASGLPADRFVFEGFLGRTRKERINKLKTLSEEKRTIVIYESPHRILKILPEIKQTLGDRRIALARELTKKFEEIMRGRVSDVEKIFDQKKPQKPRGEFTLIIEGAK